MRAPKDALGASRFHFIRRLGRGGMGEVFEAHDRERDLRVALKVLKRLSPNGLLRFKDEFRTLAELRHTNLVQLHELIEDRGEWFFTMELVDGTPLTRYIRASYGEDISEGLTRSASPTRETAPVSAGDEMFAPIESPTLLGSLITLDDAAVPPREEPHRRARIPTSRDPGYDETRLRDALAQLGAALGAIHRGGKLHRDLKPSNVLVSEEGRVVVLDFGIAIDLDAPDPVEATEHLVVGTPLYMAPEQARSEALSAAADWYAVGVMMHELLTGRAPFGGTAAELLLRKTMLQPTPVRQVAPWVPAPLATLCDDLLALDPARRPSGDEFFARLHGGTATAPRRRPSETMTPEPDGGALLGREPELALLERELARVRAGQPVVVAVVGESGIGKSSLVRQFGDTIRAGDREALILSSRCYELELVPYKALDRAIDQLSRYLVATGLTDPEPIHHAAVLSRTFPVLRNVDAVARASASLLAAADPQEQRARTFASLRALLAWLAARHALILVVDDLQWADGDSQAMLAELLRPPGPPLLFLALCRGTLDGSVPAAVEALGVAATPIALGRLPGAAALALAEGLMTRAGVTGIGLASALVDEANGHPLFLDELVRHAGRGGSTATPIRLAEALAQRIDTLEPSARQVLELLAVAGQPITRQTLSAAIGRIDAATEVLRHGRLLRTSGMRGQDLVEPYHDRIRETVLDRLSPTERADRSTVLARALERVDPQASEALARLWLGAGDREAARRHALAAGERADQALAFDQAASSYRLALSLCDPGPARAGVLRKLGEALGNLGHGVDAAAVFLEVVELEPTAPDAVDLTRKAAEQLLHAGRIDQGLSLLRRLVASFGGVWLDASKTVPHLLAERALIYLRALRTPPAGDAALLRAEDTAWAVTVGMAAVDPRLGMAFHGQSLALAFKSGVPARLSRALSLEAGFLAGGSHLMRRPAGALMARARRLADESGDAYTRLFNTALDGIAAYLQGEWRKAATLCDEAERAFRDHFAGLSWELGNSINFAMLARFYLGDVVDFRRTVPLRRREAEERGNLYRETNLKTGVLAMWDLLEGRPAEVLANAADVMRRWSQRGFHVQHYQHWFARTRVALYLGEPERAHQICREVWPAFRAAGLTSLTFLRLTSLELRAQAALAAGRGGNRAALAEARRAAWRIRAEGVGWARALAHLTHAGIARTLGDDDRARTQLGRAVTGFEACDMQLYAAITRRALGQVVAGDEGRALVAEAEGWMRRVGVADPARFSASFAAGFE